MSENNDLRRVRYTIDETMERRSSKEREEFREMKARQKHAAKKLFNVSASDFDRAMHNCKE